MNKLKVVNAVLRYTNSSYEVPREWLDELVHLNDRLNVISSKPDSITSLFMEKLNKNEQRKDIDSL